MSDSHSYIHLRNYWQEDYQGQAQDEEFTQSSKKADRNPCPYSYLLKGERDNKYNKYIQHAVRWKEVLREKVEQGVGAGLHLKQWNWRKLCWKRWHLSQDLKEEEISHADSVDKLFSSGHC